MTTPNEFINYLAPLRNPDIPGNNAKIAKLRRGLGQYPLTNLEAISVVYQAISEDTEPWLIQAYQIIAPLFAFHPQESGKGNMGTHCQQLHNEDGEIPRGVERRFIRLLASEPNDLAESLRQVISLLKSKDVAVNWYRLLDDIIDWQKPNLQPRTNVRDKWSRAFWQLRVDKSQPYSTTTFNNSSTIED